MHLLFNNCRDEWFFGYLTHVHGDTEPRTEIYKHVEIDGNIFDDSQLNESQ